MTYSELQITTHFSLLRGASSCDELFAAAALLGLPALGIVDRNSVTGVGGSSVWRRNATTTASSSMPGTVE